jgi:hypothetical protein
MPYSAKCQLVLIPTMQDLTGCKKISRLRWLLLGVNIFDSVRFL